MMGTRLHTGTAERALLPDGDQLSPVANAAVEDRAASETADFASTLQDLIDSRYQKESDLSSESSVAVDASPPEVSRQIVAGTTTNAGPQRAINHAKAPIVSSGTTSSAVKSTYIAAGSKAYETAIQPVEALLRGAKSITNSSDPTESSLPSTVETKVAGTTSHFAFEAQLTDSGISATGLARDSKSTINQDNHDPGSPIPTAPSTQPKAGSSESTNIRPQTLQTSVTGDMAKQSAATSVGGIEVSRTRIERNIDDVSVSPVQVPVANSAPSKTFPHAVAREDDAALETTKTVAIPISSANRHLTIPASPSTLVATYNRFTKYSVMGPSNSPRPSASGSRNAGLQPTIADGASKSMSEQAPIHQQNNPTRSSVGQVTAATVRADFAKTTASLVNGGDPKQLSSSKIAKSASESPGPALSASQTLTSYPLLRTEKTDAQTSASNVQVLAPSESRKVPLKPADANVFSKAETPTVKRNNASGSSAAQITPTALRLKSTEVTLRAVDADEPTQSPPIKLAKSDSHSPGLAPLASESVPGSSVRQTEKVHDVTSVGPTDSHKAASDETSRLASTALLRSSNSSSFKPVRSESSTPDELPERQNERSVTLATRLTAKAAISTEVHAGASNDIAHTATIKIASKAIDVNNAAVKPLDVAGIDQYQPAQKNDVTHGAAESVRTGDRVVDSSLAPAVSSGAKHLASDVAAYTVIVEAPAPTQTPHHSESTTHPLQGAGISETAAPSATRASAPQIRASKASHGDLEDSRNSNAAGSHSAKASGLEHPASEAAALDQIHLAESAPLNDPVKVDSLARASLEGISPAKSAANSASARDESRGDLRSDQFVESSALPPNEAPPNSVASGESEKTPPTNEPRRVVTTVGTSGLQNEAPPVSNIVSATTQPDAHTATSELLADSQVPEQPVRTSDEPHLPTYNDLPVLAADAHTATVSEDRQVRLPDTSNDSAASPLRSLDENSTRKVSPAVETNSAPSNSMEEAALQGRLLAEAAGDAPLPPLPSSTTPVRANALVDPSSTPSFVLEEQSQNTTKQDSIVVSDDVVRPSVSDSTTSHIRSLNGNAGQSASPTFETSSTPSASAEAGTRQSVLLPEATNEAASLPPQLTSTPANTNPLAAPGAPSFIAMRQSNDTNTLDSNDVSHRDVTNSAASEHKSPEETTSRTVLADSETASASSTSSEPGKHQDRLIAEVAGETFSLSLQPTSTLVHANAQPESANPPSNIDTKSTAQAQTSGSIVSPNAILRTDNLSSSGRAPEPATVSVVQDATPTIEGGRVANLQVELANGGSTQATIRERAGSIEVKIVTPTSASAQRVSGEIDSMRQNLDNAGIRLGQAEVSYQPGDGGGRGGNGHQRPPQRDTSTKDGQIFTLSEVTE